MILVRALARLVGMVWMLAVAALGLGVAAYCFDAVIALHSVRPDRLLHLPTVRRSVGRELERLAAQGPTAALALVCGLGAILIGLILLIGVLVRRRRHAAILSEGDGQLSAHPRVLRAMARSLASEAEGVTAVRRPRLRLSRRGTRGSLRLTVTRTSTADSAGVERALGETLTPITAPFTLRPRLTVRRGEAGERVQ